MKKIVWLTTLLLTGVVFLSVTGVCWAASLKFDKTSLTVNQGETFDIQVIVDAGSEQITSADAYVLYNSSILEAQSVANGSYFPSVNPQISAGTVYIAGLVDDPASSKTGSGTLATIKFKALTNGNVTLSYNCSGTSGPSKIIKNDINTTNIIDCASNGTAVITVGSSSNSSNASSNNNSSSTTADQTSQVNSLPQTGIMDNLNQMAAMGLVLIFLGGLVKFFYQN